MARGTNVKMTDEVRILKRQAAVAESYLRGVTIANLAEQQGVSPNTISKDLQACRERWLQRMVEAFDKKKAEELARLDNVEAQAWAGWEKSIRDREVVVTRTDSAVQFRKQTRKGAHKMVPIKTTTEKSVYGQAGDPRFLEVVHKVIETRLKIMGVFKEGSSQQIVQINWGDMVRTSKAPGGLGNLSDDPIERTIIEARNVAGIQTEPDEPSNNGREDHQDSVIIRHLPRPEADEDEEDDD